MITVRKHIQDVYDNCACVCMRKAENQGIFTGIFYNYRERNICRFCHDFGLKIVRDYVSKQRTKEFFTPIASETFAGFATISGQKLCEITCHCFRACVSQKHTQDTVLPRFRVKNCENTRHFFVALPAGTSYRGVRCGLFPGVRNSHVSGCGH